MAARLSYGFFYAPSELQALPHAIPNGLTLCKASFGHGAGNAAVQRTNLLVWNAARFRETNLSELVEGCQTWNSTVVGAQDAKDAGF